MAFVIITSERQVGSATCCAYVLTYMEPQSYLQLERLQHSCLAAGIATSVS